MVAVFVFRDSACRLRAPLSEWCSGSSPRRHDAIAPRIARSLKKSVGMPHDCACMPHDVGKIVNDLDVVATLAQPLDHRGVKPALDFRLVVSAPQVRPNSQRGAVTAS